MIKRRFALLILLACLVVTQPVAAQDIPNFMQVSAEHDFGQQVILRAKIEAGQGVRQAQAFLRAEGDNHTITFPAEIDENGNLLARHDINQGRLRPFATVSYWFRIFLADQTTVDSPQYSFEYNDNRFFWQNLQDDQIIIHWYAGDLSFGQDALDSARAGLAYTSQLLNAQLSQPVDIYIYADATDMRATIDASGQAWVAGHASPDLRLALVSIPPGSDQILSMERKIPHELAHILTYEVTGDDYQRQPMWLREGIATVSEIYPSPDYQRSLDFAVEKENLLYFSNLCGDFPADASSRFLAYAQSESFTRYLVEQYGTSGLGRLIQAYNDGLGCEQGFQKALGRSLLETEYNWRNQYLGENRMALAFKNLASYLVVLAVLLVLPFSQFFLSGKPKEENE